MACIPYHLYLPDALRSCAVFASPHSGRDYPSEFLKSSVLDTRLIRSSEDAWVDLLYDSAPDHGAPLLLAGAPRAYVDLNRAADELDPALIEGVRRAGHNPRIASGLGVVPRVVAGARAIYRGKLSRQEAERRIEQIWKPYHAKLALLMEGARARFGQAVLIDCHSMPHEALHNVMRDRARRPEIVIGDRFGASASPAIVDQIEAIFVNAGFEVARNVPFAGAYITQAYGRPSRGYHAVQIEIDRALYMNERTIQRTEQFGPLQTRLRGVVAELARIGMDEAQKPLAAE
ncbi:N-formylglutamate amidohydrolase [Sagittula sp. SSi028]|uniref:N-formylglutamate amidohydrolase n=1 Tax=Sagittula sp. SSi028 TaxID=3400636 RepID=UPI003AF43AC4